MDFSLISSNIKFTYDKLSHTVYREDSAQFLEITHYCTINVTLNHYDYTPIKALKFV